MSQVATHEIPLVALIVDDEKSICQTLAGVLSDEGWGSVYSLNGREGVRRFVRDKPDIVLLDVWMTGMDGIETLQRMKQLRRDIPIVIMSGHGTIETAVKATKLGAFDYLEKPLSLEKLLPMLEHARSMRFQREKADTVVGPKYQLLGDCDEMQKVREKIRLVAPRNASVLITGENGTGKEVVAQQIHMASSRSEQPFVAINCAAIPEELIESELFGHEKGAFTNALAKKKGKFEIANKGTLFLDEIADMSLKTQAKILRILQEQEFERVGGHESIGVDVRVVAATNKNLEEEIEKGSFREDLYYRLAVIPFSLPPLRERGDDIIALAKHFIGEFSSELGEASKEISPEVEQALRNYRWPGNVRELRNTMERLCIMVPDTYIKLADLPDAALRNDGAKADPGMIKDLSTLKEARSEFEKSFIIAKLEENDWNVSKTAEAIGIERSNLHRKLKAFDIDLKELKG